ncbi:MAG: TatD family hydrolase [Oscillospiraceae bacterium]|nr:TatD family hydrolase [Oscillospiraceae bacterium]
MLHGLIDTHAHMDDPCFQDSIETVLLSERQKGVERIITSGSELPSSIRSVALAERFDMVCASVGVYPNEAANAPAGYLQTLRDLASSDKVVAIGEIGMDYGFDPLHYDRDAQLRCFREQLELAKDTGLPVVIHDRCADEDVLGVLREYRPQGVIHRIFSELQYARAFWEMGLYLGIGPQVTYPGSQKLVDTVREMPMNCLVLETDAPFLPPAHLQGQPALPSMTAFVAEKIAEIRGDITPQEVVDTASANSRRLFKL